MTQTSIENRRQKYFQLNSQFVQMDNAQLLTLFESGDSFTGWGRNHVVEVGDSKVFIKRVPVTDVEQSNMFSTRNLYSLPLYYNYGVGSAGFGVFRELVAHVKTTNWVLNGEIESFPLLYHYRMMPFAGERVEVNPDQYERYVTYWGGNENIGRFRLDKINADYELVLCLEHFPHVLESWLLDHSDQIDHVLEQLHLTIDFLRAKHVIHFDANFDNILTDGKSVYLSDFGLILDRKFALSEEEIDFFDTHSYYDHGQVLANLIFPIYSLYYKLPEDQQRQLRQKYGVSEQDVPFRKLIAVLFENIEEIHEDGSIKIDQAYVDCLLRYRDICMLMANFHMELRQTNQKDTKYPRAELERLLREADLAPEIIDTRRRVSD